MAIAKYANLCIIVVIFMQYAINDAAAQNDEVKYSCFAESHERNCEASRIKIGEDFYSCAMSIKLDSPPRQIGFMSGNILFSTDGRIYEVNRGSEQPKLVNKVIPAFGEFFDKNGNIYFSADGTSYLVQRDTGKEIEIVTSGTYSYNEHTVDVSADKLFILSFNSNVNANDRTGEIYVVTTDPLPVTNGKVRAELVKAIGDRITAFTVEKDMEALLLGMKENNGGKLIRLKRFNKDPCLQNTSNKILIMNLIKEVKTKIIELIDKTPEPPGNILLENRNKDLESLFRENFRLKTELGKTTDKLKVISNKLIGFSKNFQRRTESYPNYRPTVTPGSNMLPEYSVPELPVNPEHMLIPPPPVRPRPYPTTTQVPNSVTENDDDHTYVINSYLPYDEPYDCIPRDELDRLRYQVNELEKRERDTQFKFAILIGQLVGVLNISSSEILP